MHHVFSIFYKVILAGVMVLFASGMYSEKYTNVQARTDSFVRNQFIMENGGVRTNFHARTYTPEFAVNTDVLSESQGLLMEYAVAIDDEPLFSQMLNYIEKTLVIDNIISYRYSDEYGLFQANAAIDDFRIIRALINASEVFNNQRYLELANHYAVNLYQTNVVENSLVDYHVLDYKQHSNILTLCYADFKSMQMLMKPDNHWASVYDSAMHTVQNGYISDTFPLFATAYEYQSGTYTDNDIVTCQSLLTALHLAEVGRCPEETIAYIKTLVANRELFNTYDSTGISVTNIYSTTDYALASMLGKIVGDYELQAKALEQMMHLHVKEKRSPVYGGFADVNTNEAYSFDNLNALLALQAIK